MRSVILASLSLLVACGSPSRADDADGGDDSSSGGTAGSSTDSDGSGGAATGGAPDGSTGGSAPADDTLDDVNWELGGLNADLPDVDADCRTSSSFGCLHFSGQIDGEPVSETCLTGGMASIENAFFCGPAAFLQNGKVFEIRLDFGDYLEPNQVFDVGGTATVHPIDFRWVTPWFATHAVSTYQIAETHDEELRLSGIQTELVKEDGDIRERVTGTFAATWTPKADCSGDCVNVRIRGEFSSVTPRTI